MKNILITVVIFTVIAAFYYLKFGTHLTMVPPYPDSLLISAVDINWSTHIKKAPGSDNWPLTWADDNHQYSSWGDGGGFGGSNGRGRVSLGFARIEGNSNPEDSKHPFRGINIFGGFQPKTEASFDGKSYGILSIENSLYAWVSPGSGPEGYNEARLYLSQDYASSWNALDWSFSKKDKLVFPTFLQFGKNYTDARDGYVYIYASLLQNDIDLSVQKPGHIVLMRVPSKSITDRSQYEVFAGLTKKHLPEWSTNLTDWQPVFNDPNGVGWNMSVSYNNGLKRYFLITEHHATSQGYIGIFDSSSPWGPWTTTYYAKLGSLFGKSTFYYNFSNKWLSQDGKRFVLVFSGTGDYDAYNSVTGRFVLHE